MLGCCARESLVPFLRVRRPASCGPHRPLLPFVAAPIQRHASSTPLDTLSEEQKDILVRALNGANVFVTGPSGSGKSYLLKIIAEQLAARRQPYLLTGGTSLSAFDVGGTLLHTFTEGRTVGELDKLQARRRKDPASVEYRAKWQRLETLIIDDISRIDASLFDSLDNTARKMKSRKDPFGGIQIITSGDFFQLPPESVDMPAPDYVFNATQWKPTFSTNQIELSKVFSQSETEFVDTLNQARIGKISSRSIEVLASLARPLSTPGTELCPLHVQSKMLLTSHLESLPGNVVHFWARDQRTSVDNKVVSRKLSMRDKEAYDEIVPEVLELKVGARVICTQDLDIGPIQIPKFTFGTVTNFSTTLEATKLGTPHRWRDHRSNRQWPVVRFETGEKVIVVPVQFKFGRSDGTVSVTGSRTQIPLRLAPAGLVHDFQSSSCISRVKIDLSKRFPQGLAYTALARAKSPGGLEVLNYSPGSIAPPERVISWYRKQPWARFSG